eukprot:GHUV01030926.1.p1 GENE.GHUV01030926.1~~GHUV01030926.1.p1  ORF type:complete len:137 (-),score=18.11 GHUV01030926.1:431-841(-)
MYVGTIGSLPCMPYGMSAPCNHAGYTLVQVVHELWVDQPTPTLHLRQALWSRVNHQGDAANMHTTVAIISHNAPQQPTLPNVRLIVEAAEHQGLHHTECTQLAGGVVQRPPPPRPLAANAHTLQESWLATPAYKQS